MNFEDYKNEGVITSIEKSEKVRYVEFHKNAYMDDLKVADKIFTTSPRWTIVAGYYAMHDVTKLYLAKQHDIKIKGRGVHLAAIIALRNVLSDRNVKEKAITLLTQAQEVYDMFSTPVKEKIIPNLLSKGKEEREKSQYYSEDCERLALTKSRGFLQNIVRPFIELMEKMI